MKKLHTVYKTTCLITGNYYFGKHTTVNPDDDYLGSGIRLLNSVEKYGPENHKKEIIKICESEDEAFHFEKLYISANKGDECMNISDGGDGGFGHLTHDIRRLQGVAKSFEEGRSKGWQLTAEQRKELFSGEKNGFHGKTHTKEARNKIGELKKMDPELIERRIEEFNGIEKKWGYISRLAEQWNISHTQVKRFMKQYDLV